MEHFHQVQDQLREPYRQLQAAIPEVMAGYGALHDAAMAEGALPAKVKELIALAISITRECDGCVVAHARGAAPPGRHPPGTGRDDRRGHQHERRSGHRLGPAGARRLSGVRSAPLPEPPSPRAPWPAVVRRGGAATVSGQDDVRLAGVDEEL